jgi:hypothetical protein
VAEVIVRFSCGAAALDDLSAKYQPKFFLRAFGPLKIRAQNCLEISDTNRPMTQQLTPKNEDLYTKFLNSTTEMTNVTKFKSYSSSSNH